MLTDERLAEIQASHGSLGASLHDVGELLAEVFRLKAENATLATALHTVQTATPAKAKKTRATPAE